MVIDPDAEVQAAIRDLFAAFAACGSAYGVVAAFAGRRFPLRAYGGAWAGQLRWGALTHARVLGVLKNPCYAGAYVHGRYTSRRTRRPDGTVHTGLIERPRAEWPVLINDHHDGYIGWADYLANEAKLAANRTNAGARPPREGSALCQGIIVCGSCGKPMRTNYHTDQRPAYECSRRADRLTTPTCRSVAAATVDDAVAERLLAALNPTEVALALAAADEVADRHRRIGRAAELAVERARYEADRAERAFHAVEPENRLVARTLETRWETKLAALADAEQALAAARDTLPPLPEPGRARETGRRPARALAGAHHQQQGPQTAAAHPDRRHHPAPRDPTTPRPGSGSAGTPAPPTNSAWPAPSTPAPPNAAPPRRSTMVTRLGPTTATAELVDLLNAAGLTTGTGRPFDVKAVQWIRHAYHIPAPTPYADGEISVADAAERLGCSIGVVYDWIKTGKLAARRGTGNRLCIPWTEQIEAECRCRITESGHLNPAAHHTKPRDSGLNAHDVGAGWHHHSATNVDQHPSQNPIPTRDCRKGQYETSVPVIMDRCHQARVRNALEPEWEARFEPRSYGFRPGRSCQDAIGAIYTTCKGPRAKRVWALDADLAAALDASSHCGSR